MFVMPALVGVILIALILVAVTAWALHWPALTQVTVGAAVVLLVYVAVLAVMHADQLVTPIDHVVQSPAKQTVKVPWYVCVEDVYPEADFSQLGI